MAADTSRIRQLLESPAEAARLSPAAREMLEGIRRAGQVERSRQGPQSYGNACGVVNDHGYCMSMGHSLACASSMQSAVSKATMTEPGTPESERAWEAAAEERRRARERMAAPISAESAAVLANEKADREALERAHREQAEARRRTGANWVATGQHPDFLTNRR